MRKRDRQRHQLGCLAAREADHHALIAGALELERIVPEISFPLFERMRHAGCDVRRLLLQIDLDQSVVSVEPDRLGVVADATDRVANRALDVQLGVGCDLTDDNAQAFGDRGLARNARITILREHAVEHRVGDLVADLVGVTFGHRFRGQQIGRGGAEGRCHRWESISGPAPGSPIS